MISIPIPNVLESPSGDTFRVLRRCSGSVFLALNITYGDDGEDTGALNDGKGTGVVAVKFEPKHIESHRLHDRAHAYNTLAGGPGIPFVHYSGTTEYYRYIIMDLLGPSLESLFTFCNRKFTLKTILLIADQALSRIEYIHSQSYTHSEIIPKNLVMGFGKFGNLLHLINPGSAKYPDAHLDIETSFRNDLASLGYVLLHFAWPELPWEDLKSKPTEYLCQRLPKEFATYFNFVRNLRSHETSCYSYLRKIFDDLFRRMGFERDYVFDWTIRKYQKLAERAKAIAQQPEPLISGQQSSAMEDKFTDFVHESSVRGGAVTLNIDMGPKSTCDIIIAPQLESRPLSHDQLVAEVTGMYAGLIMVENKCIEVDKKHGRPRQADSAGHRLRISDHQCLLALIGLHRVQLFEMHDIISASQHPAAKPSLQKLASQRKLPTRMFRHGIQPLLDILLLRHHFPESRSHLLSFLRLSYSLAALLYETAPRLKATWIEYLYELARVFKDVIVDDDIEAGAIWEKRIWYWNSRRHPAVRGILQADISDVMLPLAFPALLHC